LTAKKSGLPSPHGFPHSSQMTPGFSLLLSAGHRIRSTRKAHCTLLLAIFAKSSTGRPVSLGARDTSAEIYTYMDSSNQVRLVLDVPLSGTVFSEGSEFPELSHQPGLTK